MNEYLSIPYFELIKAGMWTKKLTFVVNLILQKLTEVKKIQENIQETVLKKQFSFLLIIKEQEVKRILKRYSRLPQAV